MVKNIRLLLPLKLLLKVSSETDCTKNCDERHNCVMEGLLQKMLILRALNNKSMNYPNNQNLSRKNLHKYQDNIVIVIKMEECKHVILNNSFARLLLPFLYIFSLMQASREKQRSFLPFRQPQSPTRNVGVGFL